MFQRLEMEFSGVRDIRLCRIHGWTGVRRDLEMVEFLRTSVGQGESWLRQLLRENLEPEGIGPLGGSYSDVWVTAELDLTKI